jgi:hypothetical protein
VHVGIADHLGWAVAVTASARFEVVDRRRIELLDPGLPVAPVHHEGGTWPEHGSKHRADADLAELVAQVRSSALRMSAESVDRLAAELPAPIESISLRSIRSDVPTDIAVLRRPPWEARIDAIMYRQLLADIARARGWRVCFYEPKQVLNLAADRLGGDAGRILDAPRATLGAPWTADHRAALAAAAAASDF